jgi:hypothetical protein
MVAFLLNGQDAANHILQNRRCIVIALRLGLVLVAAIVLVAFQPSLVFGQAEVTKWEAQTTWSATQTIDCIGTINFTITTHEVITERVDAHGGYHWTYHLNQHDFTGYDDSGIEYSAAQSWTESFSCGPGCEMPSEYSWVETMIIPSHGSAPNILEKERYRVIINANGAPTVSRDIVSIECRPK